MSSNTVSKKAIFSVQKQPGIGEKKTEAYTIAFLFVEFAATSGGIYSAVSENVVYIPRPYSDPLPTQVPHHVYTTSASMYKALFSSRTPLNDVELSGYIRGQILSILVSSGFDSPENTKLIGLEAFSDINLLVRSRYLLPGDYSNNFIDVRSSFETLVETKHDIGKDKRKLLTDIMDTGIIPNYKSNPKDPNDPLYECYQCLKIYNGMLKYGRTPLK